MISLKFFDKKKSKLYGNKNLWLISIFDRKCCTVFTFLFFFIFFVFFLFFFFLQKIFVICNCKQQCFFDKTNWFINENIVSTFVTAIEKRSLPKPKKDSCNDKDPNCIDYVSRNASMCDREPYIRVNCRWTCLMCGKPNKSLLYYFTYFKLNLTLFFFFFFFRFY